MLRKKEISIVLIVILCVACVWAEEPVKTRTVTTRDPKTGKTISKQVPVVKKESDLCENTSVLVEAFVVRISAEALAEVGVNSIDHASQGITMLKILACLNDPDKARIVSGAKVNCLEKIESTVTEEERLYIKRKTENSVELKNYSSGKRFSVLPRILSNVSIRFEASYSDSLIIENEDQTIPPTQMQYDWNGVVQVKSGEAVIASAAQDEENVTFLILTATIQDSEDNRKE